MRKRHMNLTENKKTTSLAQVANALIQHLGPMERVGGPRRFYKVGTDQTAAVFVHGASLGAIGIVWNTQSKQITSIHKWKRFSIERTSDYHVDIPSGVDILSIMENVAELLINEKRGAHTVSLGEPLEEDAPTGDELNPKEIMFLNALVDQFGDLSKLTLVQMDKVAKELNEKVPPFVRLNKTLRNPDGTYDLNGMAHRAGMSASGTPVSTTIPAGSKVDDLVTLAKAKTVKKLASSGNVVLYGRGPDGTMFEIPGLEDMAAKIERLVSTQMDMNVGTRRSMAEQYEEVREKVQLVASGRSTFSKSLLVLGGPSSGKTFNIISAIKDLGLVEGKDYVSKKGGITPAALYRALLENIDGLLIFDDCDNVIDDKTGVNMLKGALDTDEVREVSNSMVGAIKTDHMTHEERRELADAVSRVYRGKPTRADMKRFDYMLRDKKGKYIRDDREEEPEYDDNDPFMKAFYNVDDAYEPHPDDVRVLQEKLERSPPNKFDFRGRIIFISNLEEEDWPHPIRTRAFKVKMNFTSEEMLDYIDSIQKHIKTPNLTAEQKKETIDYVRELYTTGKFNEQINFRIMFQAFDLRQSSKWRERIANM